MTDAPSPPPAALCCSLNLSHFSLPKCGSIVFGANSEAERGEREVWRIEGMILQCCNVPQVTVAGRGREGRSCSPYWSRRIDYGRDGGMHSRRERGRKGGGHLSLHLLEKNLWGQPIRGWVTPLSSQQASKSCATRQPTCLCSMNVWAHTPAHEQAGRHACRKKMLMYALRPEIVKHQTGLTYVIQASVK